MDVSEFVEPASEKAAARAFAREHAHERIALRQAQRAFQEMSTSVNGPPEPPAAAPRPSFDGMDFSDRPLAPAPQKLLNDFEEQWQTVAGAQQMRCGSHPAQGRCQRVTRSSMTLNVLSGANSQCWRCAQPNCRQPNISIGFLVMNGAPRLHEVCKCWSCTFNESLCPLHEGWLHQAAGSTSWRCC